MIGRQHGGTDSPLFRRLERFIDRSEKVLYWLSGLVLAGLILLWIFVHV